MNGSVRFTVGISDLQSFLQPKCFYDSRILWCGIMAVCLSVLVSQKFRECIQSLRDWGRVGWDAGLAEYGLSFENTISVTSSVYLTIPKGDYKMDIKKLIL